MLSTALPVLARYYAGRLRRAPLPTLDQLAEHSEAITGHHWVTPPPIFCPAEQHGRILGGDAPPAVLIREHIGRTRIELRPSRVHVLRDVWLLDGSLFVAGRLRLDLRDRHAPRHGLRKLSLLPQGPCAEVAQASLAASAAGSTWFGHWLMDEVPLQLLGSCYATPLGHPRADYGHEPDYRRLLGLDTPQRWPSARIDTLYLPDEFAQNGHKTRRYQYMQQCLRLPDVRSGRTRVFLKRGSAGQARRMANEDALAEELARQGYQILDIGSAPLDTLRSTLGHAELLVSVEGSHLNHAVLMMPPGGALVILNPPARFMTTVADMALFCGVDAGLYCCQATTPDGSGFVADADDVLRFADATLRLARGRAAELQAFIDTVLSLDAVPTCTRSVLPAPPPPDRASPAARPAPRESAPAPGNLPA